MSTVNLPSFFFTAKGQAAKNDPCEGKLYDIYLFEGQMFGIPAGEEAPRRFDVPPEEQGDKPNLAPGPYLHFKNLDYPKAYLLFGSIYVPSEQRWSIGYHGLSTNEDYLRPFDHFDAMVHWRGEEWLRFTPLLAG